MFDDIFFSAQSKRLDLQMTSCIEEHVNMQKEYSDKNDKEFPEVFKSRVNVEESITDFKKKCQFHEN